jgi:beta-glucosidase
MTLDEKAGLMFHAPIFMNPDGKLQDDSEERVAGRRLNHFNIYFAPEPRQHAEWHNRLQDLAKATRLGIPVTIASDPRHGFAENFAAAWAATAFSQWPEPIGFGALRDEDALREFGAMARREYRAVGIHVALHPMADLATEPRWARITHTFGEDAELAARLVAAYIRGFQGDELGPQSVACMTKHFPGGGPQLDGEDPHFCRCSRRRSPRERRRSCPTTGAPSGRSSRRSASATTATSSPACCGGATASTASSVATGGS